MAIIGGLTKGWTNAGWRVSVTQAAVTGTGGVATGLTSIKTGGAVADVANAPTTVTTQGVAGISSISAGTVNVVVLDFAAASNAVSGTARNVNVIAIGT